MLQGSKSIIVGTGTHYSNVSRTISILGVRWFFSVTISNYRIVCISFFLFSRATYVAHLNILYLTALALVPANY
jgi:hypothetical protein